MCLFSVTETKSEALWVLWFYWVEQSLSFRMGSYFLAVRKFYVARLWEIEKRPIDPFVFHHFYDKDKIQSALARIFHAWNIYHKCIERSYISDMSYNDCIVWLAECKGLFLIKHFNKIRQMYLLLLSLLRLTQGLHNFTVY